jgi:hypothetical protein
MLVNINWWEFTKETIAWAFAFIKLIVITLGWQGWTIIILILIVGYFLTRK